MADEYVISLVADIDESKSMANLQKDLKSIEKKIGTVDLGKLTGITRTFKNAADGSEKLSGALLTYKNATGKVTKATVDLDGNIKKTTASMKEASKGAMGLGSQIKEAALKFPLWLGISSVVFGVINAFKSGVEEVRELDKALIELNKVASLTSEELRSVTKQAFELGSQMGQTGKTVLEVTAEFARAGFDIQESMALATTAITLMNVGEVDLKKSTDVLISSLVNFNITAEDSIQVADKLNEVSNRTASSVDVLATGLQRSAGVLAQTGTTIDETLGLLVAGFTSLRNMEKVSTSLVTMTSRLQRMADPMSDVADLTPKLESSLRDAGVELRDRATGEFRSLYDVLKDLSSVYEELEPMQQANLNFLIAGTRNAPPLTAILRDFQLAEETVAISIDSANSAMEEQAIFMDGLEGKTNNLKSSWSEMWSAALDSQTIKAVTDGLSGILNVVTKLIEANNDLVEAQGKSREGSLAILEEVDAFTFAIVGLEKIKKAQSLVNYEKERFANIVNASTEKLKENNEEVEKNYVATFKLSEAMLDFLSNGELSEAILEKLAMNQEVLNEVLALSEEQFLSLGEQWGLTTEDMAKLNEQLTDVAIQESRNRIKIMAQELQSLESMINTLDLGSLGLAGVTSPYSAKFEDIRKEQDKINGLIERSAKIEKNFSKATKSTTKATKELTAEEKALLELQKEKQLIIKENEARLDQLNAEKEAVEELVDVTVDYLKKQKELYKEQLSDRKEALKLAKEEADLQKELAGLNKDRSKLEDELFKLKLDKSANNNARILELEEKLSENKLEIDEKLEEQAYDKKIQILDDEIDAVDDYLSKEGQIRKDAMNAINADFESGNRDLFNKLIDFNNIYGSSIQSDITNAWDSASSAVQRYGSSLGAIKGLGREAMEAQMAINSAKWHLADTKGEKDALHQANLLLANQLSGGTATYDSGTGTYSGLSGSTSIPKLTSPIRVPNMIAPPTSGLSFPAVENFSKMFPTINKVQPAGSGMQIGSLITVQGNVDKSVMPALNNAANNIANSMKNSMNNQGIINTSIM